MTEFFAGDRVRVCAMPATGSAAGRIGTVVGIERDGTTFVVVLYHVRLDGDPPSFAAGVGVPFLADELEPE